MHLRAADRQIAKQTLGTWHHPCSGRSGTGNEQKTAVKKQPSKKMQESPLFSGSTFCMLRKHGLLSSLAFREDLSKMIAHSLENPIYEEADLLNLPPSSILQYEPHLLARRLQQLQVLVRVVCLLQSCGRFHRSCCRRAFRKVGYKSLAQHPRTTQPV